MAEQTTSLEVLAVPRLKMLTIKQLSATIHLPVSSIYEKINARKDDRIPFPLPVKIGRRNLWRQSTVEAYLDRLEREAAKSR